MSRQTQGSLAIVGAIAAGIFAVAFVALMVLGDYAFSPALFLAAVVSGAAGLFLFRAFHTQPIPDMGHFPTAYETSAAAARGEIKAPTAMRVSAPIPAATAPVQEHVVVEPEVDEPASDAAAEHVEAPAEHVEAPAEPAEATDADKPTTLDGPQGEADDLKKIKGVGPKLEEMLNGMGFYHFSQIAGWSSREIAWVDENLEGFKGRVSRDDWVAQAKILADGGETEFSKAQDS